MRVVESGVSGRQQITELQTAGANAFLIGGALLQDPAPADRLREFLGQDPKAEAS